MSLLAEWSTVLVADGGQCATISGKILMQLLCAASWD